MSLDRARLEETVGWFRKAQNDLRAARVDLDADPPLPEDALFHRQQAVEKALKGFLTWHDEPFRKTHSLVELGVQCTALAPDLEETLRRTAGLSEFATRYRYPGADVAATVEEALEYLGLAQRVFDQVLAHLPAGTRP